MVLGSSDIYIKEYRKRLAEYILNKRKIRKKEISNLNSILNPIFDNECIFDIYDFETGAIYFSDEDWELFEDIIKDTYVERYKDSKQHKYILPTDSGVLLRGCHTYYYHLTKQKKGGSPTKDQIVTWKDNYIDFFDKIYKNLDNYNVKDKNHLKIVLSILDHMRDLSIHISYIQFSLEHEFQNCVDEFTSPILDILEHILSMIMDLVIIEKVNYKQVIRDIRMRINNLIEECEKVIQDLLKYQNNESLRKVIRIHRETDNFWENYVGLRYAKENLLDEVPNLSDGRINLIGVLYGGLELTLILKMLIKDCYKKTSIFYINYRKDYLDRNKDNSDISEINPNISGFEKSYNILVDDNILTGRTIRVISELFKEYYINVDKYIVLRYPGLNRMPQMTHYNTYLDLDTIKKDFIGLIMSSPYTKIKEQTNIYNEFLDELGIFTLTGYEIVKYLYKNGVYEEKTEVSFIKDFFKEDN